MSARELDAAIAQEVVKLVEGLVIASGVPATLDAAAATLQRALEGSTDVECWGAANYTLPAISQEILDAHGNVVQALGLMTTYRGESIGTRPDAPDAPAGEGTAEAVPDSELARAALIEGTLELTGKTIVKTDALYKAVSTSHRRLSQILADTHNREAEEAMGLLQRAMSALSTASSGIADVHLILERYVARIRHNARVAAGTAESVKSRDSRYALGKPDTASKAGQRASYVIGNIGRTLKDLPKLLAEIDGQIVQITGERATVEEALDRIEADIEQAPNPATREWHEETREKLRAKQTEIDERLGEQRKRRQEVEQEAETARRILPEAEQVADAARTVRRVQDETRRAEAWARKRAAKERREAARREQEGQEE